METTLQLEDCGTLYYGQVYSVCLPGAKSFSDDIDILYGSTRLSAVIQSQKQLRFCDLIKQDIDEYYIEEVTDVFKLHHHMRTSHWSFDERMIITLLRFQIAT